MNTNCISSRGTLHLLLGFLLCAIVGCKHSEPAPPPKSKVPVTETQAPVAKRVPLPAEDPREKELQGQIDLMQEQTKILTSRTEALAAFHGLRMTPKWIEKVQAARADASRPAERMRYLEATKALLARKLQSLRAEMKVYEEYESSDAAIPRPQ